jgi:hypothetical protein
MMKTSTRILLTTGLLGLLGHAAAAQTLYDDFEQVRLVAYPNVQGMLTQDAANPAKNTVNGSTTVAKFERAAAEQYATISIALADASRRLQDVTPYTTGTKKISLSFYSPMAGVPVQLVLQNKAKAAATPYVYPQGNYAGTFNATTTVANAWETLTFTFTPGPGSSDASVTATDIDQLALLINLGNKDGSTYYFDNLKGPELTNGTPVDPKVPFLYDNFEDTRLVLYPAVEGDFEQGAANPASGNGNNSPKVGKYIRAAGAQYAVITMAPNGPKRFADVSSYLAGTSKISMKFYSPKADVPVQLVLQDKTKAATGYPNGNLGGTFDAKTTVANAWQTLTFQYNPGANDPTVLPTDVDMLVMLIAPGTNNGDTYYFDDLTGPAFAVVQSSKASRASVGALAPLWPNPANTQSHLEFQLVKAGAVTVSVFDLQGRRIATILQHAHRVAGRNLVDIPTAQLAPGLYQVRLEMAGQTVSRPFSVQH